MKKTIWDCHKHIKTKKNHTIFDRFLVPEDLGTHHFFTVSGGVDSMVMATVSIYKLLLSGISKKYIHILHFNHKQRLESEYEEKAVQEFFEGIHVICGSYDYVSKGTENTLRKARWKFFEQNIMSFPGSFLYVGHHIQDKIETMMLNMYRGCGIRGIETMPYCKKIVKYHGLNYTCYRPCIMLEKQTLYLIAIQFGIPHREDSSNSDLSFSQRNKIRHGYLMDISGFPMILCHFTTPSLPIYSYIETLLFSGYTYTFRIHTMYIKEMKALYDILDFCDLYYNCSQTRLNEIAHIVFRNAGGKIFIGGWYLRKSGKYLYMIASPRLDTLGVEALRKLIKNVN